MAAAQDGRKSGYYRVNGHGTLERVSSKVIGAAALVTALGILWGVVAAGAKIAQAMQRPMIENVATAVVAPIQKRNEDQFTQLRTDQSLLLPRSDFNADRAVRNAQDTERDRRISTGEQNYQRILERLDRVLDRLPERNPQR